MSSESSPISFPTWKEILAFEPVASETKGEYRREILAFLHHCKVKRAPATVMLAKEYLAARETQGATGARLALAVGCVSAEHFCGGAG